MNNVVKSVLGSKKMPAGSSLMRCNKRDLVQMLCIADNNYQDLLENYGRAIEQAKLYREKNKEHSND